MYLTDAVIVLIILLFIVAFRRNPQFMIFFSLFIFITSPLFTFTKLLNNVRWWWYLGFSMMGLIFGFRKNMRKLLISDIFILCFITYLSFSYSISIAPNLTLQRGLAVVLMYSAFFLGYYSYITDIRKIYKTLLGLLMFVVVYDILCFMPMFEIYFHGRLGGIEGSPTGTAGLNIFIFPIALMYAKFKKSKFSLAIILFMIYVMYVTYTRTAIIALILLLIFRYSQLIKRRISYIIIIATVCFSILLSFNIFGIWLPKNLVRLHTIPYLGGRTEAWSVALKIIYSKPIFGYGFGTEDSLFDYFDIVLRQHSGRYFHNSFLGLSSQLGIPFALLFFFVVIYFTINVTKFVNKISGDYYKQIGLALNGVLFVGLVYCFSESWIYSPGSGLSFVYYLIMALAIRFKEMVITEE